MDKQTLTTYGWMMIVTVVLGVMLALSTPFGTYVGDAIVSITNGYTNVSTNALSEENVNKLEQEWSDRLDFNSIEVNINTSKHKGIIPEGGTYVTNAILRSGATSQTGEKYDYANKTTLTAGQQFPETPQSGDIYYYGNYAYIFNGMMGSHYEPYDEYQAEYDDIDGWCVTSKMYAGADPGAVLSSIAKKDVKSMRYCFYRYYDEGTIEVLPQIPETVTDMTALLGYTTTTDLRTYAGSADPDGDFSNYKIPNSVTNMSAAFYGVKCMTRAPEIQNGVTDMSSTFAYCSSLAIAPVLPNSVTNLYYTFNGCTSLTAIPEIPSSITNISYAFYGCTSLTTVPTIPNGVINMSSTFNGCTSLTTAPTIPSTVTNISYAFSGCTSLTTAPTIPSSVTNIAYTFNGCTSLTGTITINANPTIWTKCLYNTQITSVAGSTTKASAILKTKTSTATNPT